MRVNGKIRAREVRVIGPDGKQLGIFQLNDALILARQHKVDLVEISATAVPPVCRLVEIGKFRYEQNKKEKESRKHQHASTVKEVQLSPRIGPHDLGIKVQQAVNFLCEDMKVKVVLKFRGREMSHTEIGFEVVNKFLAEITPYGQPDFAPKLSGRAINLMITPLPRNKRAKTPRQPGEEGDTTSPISSQPPVQPQIQSQPKFKPAPSQPVKIEKTDAPPPASGFTNNPFAGLEIK
jgi:translation initiation factor IF-3